MKSKKVIIVSLLFILSFNFIMSQNRFGVFGGVNNSVISDGFFKKTYVENGFGLHLGVLYEYGLSEKIVFRPKIVYSQQGDRKKTSNSFIDSDDIDYKLDYINIPLNFKFFQKPYIIAGPQIGYLLSTDKQSADYGDVKSKVDYGLNLGVGYDINNFFIELNLYQGMNTLVEIEEVFTQSVAVDGKNTVLQLSFGYYFD
jgi:hypothetical protein